MSIRSGECPHGHALLTIKQGEWYYGVPQDCSLCAESEWTTAGYRPGPPQAIEQKEKTT